MHMFGSSFNCKHGQFACTTSHIQHQLVTVFKYLSVLTDKISVALSPYFVLQYTGRFIKYVALSHLLKGGYLDFSHFSELKKLYRLYTAEIYMKKKKKKTIQIIQLFFIYF